MIDSSVVSPVHVLMLNVHPGLSRLRAPSIVPCIISSPLSFQRAPPASISAIVLTYKAVSVCRSIRVGHTVKCAKNDRTDRDAVWGTDVGTMY